MPIKDLGRALAMSMLMAASAAYAEEPSSRRARTPETLPGVDAETGVTQTAKKGLLQPRGVKAAGTIVPTSAQTAAPPTTLRKSAGVKGGVKQVKQDVPEPDPVPAAPGVDPAVAASADAGSNVATSGTLKTGSTVKVTQTVPKYGTGRGPYLHERVEYRWQKFKYRWDHYYKPGMQETHWGYPEEFCEKPLGYYNYAHARTMVANGEAARMMLYQYDFVDGEARLNERGREQLAKLAHMLPRNFFPLVIEADYTDPELAEKRRALILDHLHQSGFPVPEQRVVITSPMARGLQGAEGESIGNSYFDSFQRMGVGYGFYTSMDDLTSGNFGTGGAGTTASGSSTGQRPGGGAGGGGGGGGQR